jgi:hypothetical protein
VGCERAKHLLAVGDAEADVQLGPVLAKVLDQGGHEVLAGGENGRKTKALIGASRHAPSDLGALLEEADHMARVAGVLPTRRGGPHIAPGALGQLDAELALERGDRGADARLRDVELLRGRGHRAMPHDSEKRGQLSMSNGHGRPESI